LLNKSIPPKLFGSRSPSIIIKWKTHRPVHFRFPTLGAHLQQQDYWPTITTTTSTTAMAKKCFPKKLTNFHKFIEKKDISTNILLLQLNQFSQAFFDGDEFPCVILDCYVFFFLEEEKGRKRKKQKKKKKKKIIIIILE
jgi:hypothetical protein